MNQPNENTRWVVLEHDNLSGVGKFWTSYDPETDTPDSIIRVRDGQIAYKVIGYCSTPEEAKEMCLPGYRDIEELQ